MSAFEFALRDLHTGHRTILSYGQNIIVEDSDGGIAARSMKSSEDGTNLASIHVELGRAYMTITSIMNQLAVRPSSNEPLSEAQVAWYNSRLQTLAGHGNERMMELRPDDCIMVVGTKHRWTLEVQLLSESGHAPTHQVNAETLNQAAGSPTSSFPLDGLFKATKSMNPEHRTIAGSEMRIRAVQALEIQESDNAEIAGDNHELKTANEEVRPVCGNSDHQEDGQSPSITDWDFAEFVTTPSVTQEDGDCKRENMEIEETQNVSEDNKDSSDPPVRKASESSRQQISQSSRPRDESPGQESSAVEDSQINVIPTPAKTSRKRGLPDEDTDSETTYTTQERQPKKTKGNQVKKSGAGKSRAKPKGRVQQVKQDQSKTPAKTGRQTRSKAGTDTLNSTGHEADDQAPKRRQTRSRATNQGTLSHANFGDEVMENDSPRIMPPSRTESSRKKTAKKGQTAGATLKSDSTSGNRAVPASETERSKSKTPMRVCFSNTKCAEEPAMKKFLKSQQVKEVGVVSSCDMLCIGRGQLRKRPKVLMAVALGKRIVTDLWLERSKARGCLLDEDDFLASDNDTESAFGFDPREAVGQGRRGLFKDHQVYFSANLRQSLGPDGYGEMSKLVSTCGGKVRERLPPAIDKGSLGFECIVLIQDDKDPRLELEEDGVRCYGRDLVSYSILRGELDLDSKEFIITAN